MTNIWDLVHAEEQQYGVPAYVGDPIVYMESGGDPNASNPSGAVGLLGLLEGGGQGAGYTTAQLQNPALNLQIGLPPIAKAYQDATAAGLDDHSASFIAWVASHSGHVVETGEPAPTASLEQQQQAYDAKIAGLYAGPAPAIAGTPDIAGGGAAGSATPANILGIPGLPGVGPQGWLNPLNQPPWGSINVPNPLNAIGDGIKGGLDAVGSDIKAFVSEHALEIVVLLVAVFLLFNGASRIMDGKIPIPV